VPVVPGDLPGGVALPRRPDGVGVVEPQDPPVVPVVKGQGISDAVRDMRLGLHPPHLELGPITIVHREDLAVEVQQADEAFIFPGRSLFLQIHYHQMISNATIF
jgi:hypothetical protein